MFSVFPIVTPYDRARGIEACAGECPLALASQRALRTAMGRHVMVLVASDIRVILKDVALAPERPGDCRRAVFFDVPLPPEARDYRDNFDGGFRHRLPETLSFEIPVPDNLPLPDRSLVTC